MTSDDSSVIVRGRPLIWSRPRTRAVSSSSRGQRGADRDLDLLGRAFADDEVVTPADVLGDRLVETVTGNPHRLADDHPEHRDHGRLGATAADVDDHVSAWRSDRDLGAEGGRERLRDQVRGTACARSLGSVAHGALLDAGHADRDADHHLRPHDAEPAQHAPDEVAQHGLGDQVIGDHAVAHRPDHLDAAGMPADHRSRVVTDGHHSVVALGDGDDGGLVEDNAAAALVDEHVGGPEVDPNALVEHACLVRRCRRNRCAHPLVAA